jgi:uncharacterized protein YkwD
MKKLLWGAALILMFMGCAMKNPVVKTESLDWFKQEFLTRINSVRQKGCSCGKIYYPPAPPVVWNTELETAAYWHAKDMSSKKYFSHTSQDGRVLRDRVSAVGYSLTGIKSYSIGENIALGQRSIKEVVNDWLKSEEHCKNLMNPTFKEVGVATVGNYYWVQDFGGRELFTQPAQAK